MHRILVEEKKWLGEQRYLSALSFCMLLPGPEAMQLATYAGWRLQGVVGGLIAGLLFVLPGAMVILGLATIYSLYGNLPLLSAVFLGVKAAVLIIVLEALIRVAKRALTEKMHWVIAAVAFIAIFFLALPFPLIIFLAALYGFVGQSNTSPKEVSPILVPTSINKTLLNIVVWLLIWLAPMVAIELLFDLPILTAIGVFFSKLAVVTFGGAYAVLAYMAQDVVNNFGWLSAGEMLDGLGLAETTPGPLILVTEFVGFIAAFREGGLLHGLAGAAIALWVTFVPCFLWIFAGAPYVEWISAQPRLRGALSAITAAVVGVILNLSIWFSLHVFFFNVAQHRFGLFSFPVPELISIDWRVLVLASLSAVLLLRLHWPVTYVLLFSAVLGVFMPAIG